MIQTVTSVAEWMEIRQGPFVSEKTLGFVPTMGNLHRGHISLLEKSKSDNDLTVLSIFVNPAQFDEKSDLQSYPKTLEADLRAADEAGADYAVVPESSEIYPDDYRFKVIETDLSQRFCGKHRPGHFDGVLTVVLKLLQLVRPDRAYFGEKDYQQYLLVRDMAKAFFLKTEIIPCPLVRDSDGLALSSRNLNLTPEQRVLARKFPGILTQPGSPEEIFRKLSGEGFEVDYVEDFEGRRLAAVRIGPVRLIDNVVIES